ncbi:ATP-binding protein [Luteibacter sp. PPL201]|uniref:histidine kinase n=1 Tax=Luteibacter sahnii TaxID=3021977 RepID=A0ABT6BBY8_9GAMM
MRSLSSQLTAICLVSALCCIGLGWILVGIYGQTDGVQTEAAARQVQTECARLGERFAAATDAARASDHAQELAGVVLQLVLQEAPGVEGGVYDPARGNIAYAFPTYDGSDTKLDVPQAERTNIETVASRALAQRGTVLYTREGRREALLIAACPLGRAWAAWTMTRVANARDGTYGPLAAGLAVLLAVVLVTAVGLATITRRWRAKFDAVGKALAGSERVPSIPPTGSPEIDRLSDAVMAYAARVEEARRERLALDATLQRHERLTTLGRMTATVAHEIRNPIGTMRLAAENALHADPDGMSPAAQRSLGMVLTQVDRLNRVVESLLAMVQPVRVVPTWTPLDAWLDTFIHETSWPRAFDVDADAVDERSWYMDGEQMRRAAENLVRNAMQHAPADGRVRLAVSTRGRVLRVAVDNDGEPIAADVAARLFEPFVSGRIDGHGLGLALVMDIALAHGGSAGHLREHDMTRFFIEVPWHAS